MSTKRFVALVMALAMLFTLTAPAFTFAEGETSYQITIESSSNGSVTTQPANEAAEGEEVTITVSPADGYHLKALAVKDGSDQEVTVTNNKFTMPASDVTIRATFEADPVPEEPAEDPSNEEPTDGDDESDDGESACSHSQMYHCPASSVTCGDNGNIEFWYCPDCQKCFSDAAGENEISYENTIVPVTGDHTLTYYKAVAATCTEQGIREYWYCSGCGKYYSNEQCTAELGENDLYTPTLDHSFGEWEVTIEPTCTEVGEETCTCACGATETRPVDALGHDYLVVDSSTCTEAGVNTYTCSRCNDTYTEDAPALGHDYTAVVTEPTCTEQGYTTHTCSRCGDSYADTYTDALDHDYGEWTVTTEPTCAEAGEETRTCSRCGATETRPVDALGHSFSEWTVTTEPTCTEAGVNTYTCSRCNDTYTEDAPALGHEEVIDEAVAPTCTGTGLTEGKHCSRCDEILIIQEVVPALGHTPGDPVHENVIPATFEEEGSYDEVVYCTVCGAELSREKKTIDKLELFSGTCGDNLTWTLEAGTLTITGSGAMYDFANAEDQPWADLREQITAASLQDGLTTIGDRAFSSCTGLSSVIIPDGVSSIGYGAFGGCTGIESVSIPDSVSCIGYGAFCGTALTSISIPNSVSNINGAFFGCSSLTFVNIPDGVTSIGSDTFYDCSSLTAITIPDNVTSIGWTSFCDCSSLTSITLPNGLTSIGGYAFDGCTALADVYYDGTIEQSAIIEIENDNYPLLDATWHCTDGDYVPQTSGILYFTIRFVNWDGNELSRVRMAAGEMPAYTGETPTRPNDSNYSYQFVGWSPTITVATASTVYTAQYRTYEKCGTNLYCSFDESSGTLTIIGSGAMYDFESYTQPWYWIRDQISGVSLPNGLVSVGKCAFNKCSGLTSITIPDSVTSIGAYAFDSCIGLTTVAIGNGVTSIAIARFTAARD